MVGLQTEMIPRSSFQDSARVAKFTGRFGHWVSFVPIAIAVLALAACDPASLIREKVPEPIQEVLQFTTPAKPAQSPTGVPEGPKVDIAQPAPSGVYPAGKEVLFQAAVTMPGGQNGPPPQLDWTLFKDKEPRPIPVGKGNALKKALDAGNYRVELAVDYQGQRVTQTVTFRVIHAIEGKVLTRDGRPIPETEMLVSDLTGQKVIFRAKCGRDGGFAIEIPPEGHFLLRPQKQGFGFNPYDRIVRYQKDIPPVEFKGLRAEIKDIVLTSSQTDGEALSDLCPLQNAYVKFTIEGEMKPTRMEAFLVHIADNEERRIDLDEVKNPGSGEVPPSVGASQWLQVQAPGDLKVGAKEVTCRLVLAARDERDDVITARAPVDIKVNLSKCFASRLAEAAALQEKGDLAAAITMYDSIDGMHRKLPEPAQLAAIAEKAQFNRGLAHLSRALALTPQDQKYRQDLGKALSEFSSVLKGRKKDAQALLMRGMVREILQDYDSATQDFTSALALEAKTPLALQLRARGLLAAKVKKNLLPALDDLTEAITLDPDNKDLRILRRETLKLMVQSKDEKDSATVDTSKLPLGDIEKIVKPDGYVRR